MKAEVRRSSTKPEVVEAEVIEGTGAELAEQLRLPERADRRFRVVSMQEKATEAVPLPDVAPNAKALAALSQIAENQIDRPYSDGSDTQRLIREARAGAMYG